MEVRRCCNCINGCCSILVFVKDGHLFCGSSIGRCNTAARGYPQSNQRYNFGNKLVQKTCNGFTLDFLSKPQPRVIFKKHVKFRNNTRLGRKVLSCDFVQSYRDKAWFFVIYVYDEYPYKVEIVELYQYGDNRAIASFYMNSKPTIKYLGKQEVEGEIYPEFQITGNNIIKNVKIMPESSKKLVRETPNKMANDKSNLSQYNTFIEGGGLLDISSIIGVDKSSKDSLDNDSFFKMIRNTFR